MNSLFTLYSAAWQTDPSFDQLYNVGNAAGWLARGDKQASTNYPLSGRLYLAKSGWLLLSVPNALVRGVFDAMTAPGAELPLAGTMNVPNVEADVLNAHISVMTADEVASIGANKINERGHHFGYSLGPVHEIDAKNIDGVSKVWAIQVTAPSLSVLRKSYGLSPLPKGDHPFHITVAVRRTNVLGNNGVSKFDGAAGRVELKAAAEAPWATFVVAPHEKGYAATTRPTGDGKFGLPGGKLEPGEDPLAAVQREAKEEGWDVSDVHPEPLHKSEVDGKPVWWYRAAAAKLLKDFKEKGRVVPTTAQQDQLTEFGNDVALKRYLNATKVPADLTRLAPKWKDRQHILAALPKHLSDTQTAIQTNGNVDKEMTDLALIAKAWLKSQRQKQLLAERLQKFQATAQYPSLAATNKQSAADQAALKTAAEQLPWRERVEIYTKHPKTGKIFGGVWDNDKSFAVPGGGIDPGETPEQAAVRELAEEAGLNAANPVRVPVGPIDNPWSDEYRASNGRNFAGSRTHFVVADFINKARKKNLDVWHAKQQKFYSPEAALELMHGKQFMSPDVAKARMKVLQHIIDNAGKKTAAADPDTSILISGHSGAGKSTLSKALAEKLRLPLHSADKHPDFTEFFKRPGRVNGAETIPGTPEYEEFQKLRKRVGEEVLANASGPAVIEGIQLAALPPEQLQQYKHRIYVQTPIAQLLKQRFERQRARAESKGRPWTKEELPAKRQIGRQIFDAQKPLMDSYAALPGTIKYKTHKNNVDDIIKRLNLKTAADLLPGGEADNVPDSEFPKSKLQERAEHEHEHTSNDQVAKEIAKDHLSEDPQYYEKQEALEKESKPQILKELLEAKEHSDNKRYDRKAAILRRLMAQSPQDWVIDDAKPRNKGVTHTPTKFKFHTPPETIPHVVKAATGSVYMNQLRNSFFSRDGFKYDHNKPVFENIQDHMRKIKQQGDWILKARRNDQIYRASLDPKYRHQLALQAFYGTMPQPAYFDQAIERYGDGLLGVAK